MRANVNVNMYLKLYFLHVHKMPGVYHYILIKLCEYNIITLNHETLKYVIIIRDQNDFQVLDCALSSETATTSLLPAYRPYWTDIVDLTSPDPTRDESNLPDVNVSNHKY